MKILPPNLGFGQFKNGGSMKMSGGYLAKFLFLSFVSLLILFNCPWSEASTHNFGIVCLPGLKGADEWEHPDRMLKVYKDLGVKIVIVHFSWQAIEPQKEEYSQKALRLYDDVVHRLSEAGIEINAMLVRTPRWAVDLSVTGEKRRGMKIFAPPPKDPRDFAHFAKFIATRYKGKIKHYLFYNATNIKKRWIDPKYLVKVQSAGYNAMKSVDRHIKIAMPSLEGRIYRRGPYLEQFLQNGGGKYTDVYDFHMNWASWIFQTEEETLRIQAILKRYGEDKKIIQYGSLAVPSQYTYTQEQQDVLKKMGAQPWNYTPRTSEIQAQVLVTQMVLGRSLGVQNAFWGRTRDWKTDPESVAKHRGGRLKRLPRRDFYGMNKKEAHDMTMGIVSNDYSPKPSFYAFKTLIAKVGGADCVKRFDFEKGKAVFFRKSNKLIGILWNPDGEKDITLKVDADKVTLVNMYGGVIKTIKPKDGIVNIRIGPSPIYMEGAYRVDRM